MQSDPQYHYKPWQRKRKYNYNFNMKLFWCENHQSAHNVSMRPLSMPI